MEPSPLSLAQDLLRAVRSEGPHELQRLALQRVGIQELRGDLVNEASKRAFWLNVYNAFGQILLQEHPADLRSATAKLKHYGARRIEVAGQQLSLNDVEHGLLRGSRIWWSKGYFKNPFVGPFEQEFRVPLDPRIHFALNCGATSCPPIAFFTARDLNAQLDLATKGYLSNAIVYDAERNTLSVPALFNWYIGDFGGKAGVLRFLKRHGLLRTEVSPRLRYALYDWTVRLGHFSAEAG